jgi:citrate synthase
MTENRAEHKGLDGIVVDETGLSDIDGERGKLTIRGYPLEELAPQASVEETLFLLLNGHLPDREELGAFKQALAERRTLPDVTLEVLEAAAASGNNPMDALRMGMSTLRLGADPSDPASDALRAVAACPVMVAAYWRFRQGEEPVAPDEERGHAENYLYMMTGEDPTEEQVRGLETYLNAVVDHGFNASTFTARVVVSTRSDLISAVTGAIGALKGPLHGGAPGPVLDMIKDIRPSDDPKAYLRSKLENGERIMGFGHRVYNVRDPRAAVLSDAAERFYANDVDQTFFDRAKEIEQVALDVLQKHKPDRDLDTNVEFYTATLLHGIGIPKELFSSTFAVGRMGGWVAHCLEQLKDNRLIRPSSNYTGDHGRTYIPLDER